ncbi:hypothetical protein EFD55_03345 [Rhizobium pisi]|uniref:Uncharacterized protein n=1 Tax=Rhizobium pisi TaxID=574561 RepID=A0A427N749_9HYPH|nr:hypothetical protein EFD55_03345 [Rhizobium pisi]
MQREVSCGIAIVDNALQYNCHKSVQLGRRTMRICIYKSERAPELTLLLREGLPVPFDTTIDKWTKIKVVTDREMRADLLIQMGGAGYALVRLGGMRQH